MRFSNKVWLTIVFVICPFVASIGAETDMAGSKDFPDFPRIQGTYIAGYQLSQYDVGTFLEKMEDRKPILVHPEGKRTRIIYLGQENQSSIQMLRNYQKAYAGFGEYREIYSCHGSECYPNLASGIVWKESNRVPVSFRNAYALYILSNQYREPVYAYGTITTDDVQYHVSVFSTFMLGGQTGIRNKPIVHLEILEIEDFEPTLQFVDADQMLNEITQSGSVALYGLQFDFDSASLTEGSEKTVAEMAMALKEHPDLTVYVVGHTDTQGSLEYNGKLSAGRAAAVLTSLVEDHGVSAGRLIATGVGPVAPVASNTGEEGRQLNRRVEIVQQ